MSLHPKILTAIPSNGCLTPSRFHGPSHLVHVGVDHRANPTPCCHGGWEALPWGILDSIMVASAIIFSSCLSAFFLTGPSGAGIINVSQKVSGYSPITRSLLVNPGL
jgi:hypothetical protein